MWSVGYCFSFVALLCVLVVCAAAPAAEPAVVYDNSLTPTSGAFAPHGFRNINALDDPTDPTYPDQPIGDQVTLAGTERTVVRFDLLLSSSAPTTLTDLDLFFFDYNTTTHIPGPSPLWSSTLHNVAVDGLTRVQFDLPNVTFPDTFVWVVGADSDIAGLATFNPPTVGSSENNYWNWDRSFDYPDSWWRLSLGQDMQANFGATIYAVPEPASMAMLAVGGLFMLRGKRHA
ncbi:MAG: PEP-CTERM sorting domain-containing protein [Phycisphaerae bacterium]|jgi:hypothetical protein